MPERFHKAQPPVVPACPQAGHPGRPNEVFNSPSHKGGWVSAEVSAGEVMSTITRLLLFIVLCLCLALSSCHSKKTAVSQSYATATADSTLTIATWTAARAALHQHLSTLNLTADSITITLPASDFAQSHGTPHTSSNAQPPVVPACPQAGNTGRPLPYSTITLHRPTITISDSASLYTAAADTLSLHRSTGSSTATTATAQSTSQPAPRSASPWVIIFILVAVAGAIIYAYGHK